jgi:excisionase family DNA binding protein
MNPALKILYTRREAAEALACCVSTLDMMVTRKILRVVLKGRRVLIHRDELERVARLDIPSIWPPQQGGKTTRVIERVA